MALSVQGLIKNFMHVYKKLKCSKKRSEVSRGVVVHQDCVPIKTSTENTH